MTPSRIHRLSLTHFRNYRAGSVQTRTDVVVLVGPNGAGKTNCLEAISFLSPGRGLRRATLEPPWTTAGRPPLTTSTLRHPPFTTESPTSLAANPFAMLPARLPTDSAAARTTCGRTTPGG